MNRQIDKKPTKQVRLSYEIHRLVKIEAAKSGETIKSFIEGSLSTVLAVDKETK